MSSFDSMSPLESTLDRSSESDISVCSRSFDKIYPDNLVVGTVQFPTPPKPTITHGSSPISPWMMPLVYPLGRHVVIPFYFDQIEVIGRENLPLSGPVILAPTHRSRWDALLVPYAAGYDITGRHLHFMVSSDEVRGIQGWFIRRLGGFAVNTKRPAIATLRHGVELLQNSETLVIFPEGDIYREPHIQPLKPGLARLALQAEATSDYSHPGVQIVPIYLRYSHPFVPWRSRVRIVIGKPLQVTSYNLDALKQSARQLTADLQNALEGLV